MLFNSIEFAVFFPTVLVLYWLLPHAWQNRLLLAASYIFYGSWDYRFLSLLFLSTVFNYTVALVLGEQSQEQRPQLRKALLTASVVCNLGLLGFFKYCNFFTESLHHLLGIVGIPVSTYYLDIVLPIGISFYTFQALSYVIDVYRGDIKPTHSFVDFALFKAFFPQLVAGPIERASELLPQISGRRTFSRPQFVDGLHLIFWGIFKKVFIADHLAPLVDSIYSMPEPGGFDVLIGTYAFAAQIYCDFSGYTDVARGCAKCMGFEFMLNFNHPYLATNPSDFWKRWHISLSTWLRDYLYVPLGGNRNGEVKTYRNLAITMLLGGLWHGATYLFVCWGAYHGLLLILHRAARPYMDSVAKTIRLLNTRLWHWVSVLFMFNLACVGWLLFRGESFERVVDMIRALCTWRESYNYELMVPVIGFCAPLLVMEAIQMSSGRDDLHRMSNIPLLLKVIIYAVLSYLLIFHGASAQSFIYFQF